MRKQTIIAADFETTTIEKLETESLEQYRERVKNFVPEVYDWTIAIKYIDKKQLDKYTKINDELIDTKIEVVDKLKGKNKYICISGIGIFNFINLIELFDDDVVVYFHNGAKFDLHFLLPALDVAGYKQLLVKSNNLSDGTSFEFDENKEYEGIVFSDKPRKVEPKEYSLLVDGSHKIMEMKIGITSTKKRDGKPINRAVIFRDSNLMYPSRLADYGNALNKNYNTDEYKKLDLEGGYTRSDKYNSIDELLADGNQYEYLINDGIILCEFLEMMCEVLPFHKWKITAAGTAYSIWKYDIFGYTLIDEAYKRGDLKKVKHKSGFIQYKFTKGKKLLSHRFLVDKLFEKYFPVSWLDNFYITGISPNFHYVHNSYQGGLTMSNPDMSGILQKHIAYIDINSSYPTQMYYMDFPFGEPYVGDSKEPDDMKLYKLEIEHVTNKTGLPFIYDFIKEGEGKHYPYTIKNKEYLITDIELERFKKYYKGKYKATVALSFNKVSGEFLFGKYIKKFYDIKSTSKNVAEIIYVKLMLNSLYGKFGQDITRESKIWIESKWETIETINNAKFYLPLASWITAYARMYMVDAVDHKFENVVVLDTDSLSIKVPENIYKKGEAAITKHIQENYPVEINPKKLGAWDIEYIIDEMVARRAKQYFFKDVNGKKVIKYAGLRLNDEQLKELTFDEFIYGKEGFKQLRPYRTPTGLVLETYEKELKAIWEYNLNPDYWFKDEKTFKKGVKT